MGVFSHFFPCYVDLDQPSTVYPPPPLNDDDDDAAADADDDDDNNVFVDNMLKATNTLARSYFFSIIS